MTAGFMRPPGREMFCPPCAHAVFVSTAISHSSEESRLPGEPSCMARSHSSSNRTIWRRERRSALSRFSLPVARCISSVRERSRVCVQRSEEHTSELQSPYDLVCRLLLEKKKKINNISERVETCT